MGDNLVSISREVLSEMITDKNESIYSISSESPVLLVFLRHFGCLFCKEAMLDVSKKKLKYEENNIRIVICHMSEPEVAAKYFNDYKLSGVDHVSDPNKKYYSKFGLARGKTSQLYGLKTLLRGVSIVATQNIPFTLKVVGDGYQMPGVFVLNEQEVVNQYIHKRASDRPDYDKLLHSFLK